MGVRVNGVWHEELADPNDAGGSNLTSVTQSPSYGGGGGGGGGTAAAAPSSASATVYQTVNGPKTLAQMGQELHQAGWDGTGNVVDVYARTAGGNVTPYAAVGAAAPPQNASGSDLYGYYLQQALSAAAAGYKARFDEAIRQFNASFGLSEAGVTGYYQGKPTQSMQQQGYNQQTGLISLAAGLQANPFRQAQVIGQLGGLLHGGAVAGFQAPGQAQGQTDFSGMGNLQRMIDDIRGGPGAINSQSVQGVLDAIPTPAKLDSVNFMRASPLTQNIVLQGMQEKYGLSPDDALAQIKNTLPQFQAPTTFGGVKR